MQGSVVFKHKAVLPRGERLLAAHEHPYVVAPDFGFDRVEGHAVKACGCNGERNRAAVVRRAGIEQGEFAIYAFFNLIAFRMHNNCFAHMHTAVLMDCDGRGKALYAFLRGCSKAHGMDAEQQGAPGQCDAACKPTAGIGRVHGFILAQAVCGVCLGACGG